VGGEGYESVGSTTRADIAPHLGLGYTVTPQLNLHAITNFGVAQSLWKTRFGASLNGGIGDVFTSFGVDWYAYAGGGRHQLDQSSAWGPYMQAGKILSRDAAGRPGWGGLVRAWADFDNGPGVAVEIRHQLAGPKE
jgi:hypothetical protein